VVLRSRRKDGTCHRDGGPNRILFSCIEVEDDVEEAGEPEKGARGERELEWDVVAAEVKPPGQRVWEDTKDVDGRVARCIGGS
jgi:hypothetical protein